jgi:hypothetical protein
MAIINTRSPNFESIDYAGMSYATLQIFIWTGSELDDVAGVSSYTLRKSATIPTSGNPTVTFETSELIRDYLDSTFNGNYSGQGVWVKHWMKVYNSSNQIILNREFTKIALDGYSYFEEENVNEQSPMISNNKLFVLDDNTFRVPIYTNLNPTIVFIKDNEIIANQTFYKNEESSNQIKYVSIYGDNENWDTFKERVLENGATSYEPNICLQAYFNNYSIGGVDEIRLSYNNNGSELITNTDLTNSNYWTASGVTIIPAPVALSSYRMTGVGFVGSTAISNVTDGDEFTVSCWLKGTVIVVIKLQELGGDSTDYFEREVTLTSDWTYYQISGTKEADGNPARMVISQTGGSSGYVDIYQPSVTQSYGIKTDVINVETLQECKYEPKKVTFINKFGVLQDMYFFKKSVEKMNVKKESYKSNILNSSNSYSRSNHVYRDFNVVGKESVTLSSGFLSEEYNEVFKQMMLSEKVWVTNITDDGEQVLPINVKTSNITYKTSLNDKLVEYTFDFDNSFNVINDIR